MQPAACWASGATAFTQRRLCALWTHSARHGARVPFRAAYALAAFDLSIDVVLTNLVPTSPVRGAGRPNAAFVLERLADTVARRLNLPRDGCAAEVSSAPSRCLRHGRKDAGRLTGRLRQRRLREGAVAGARQD